MTWKFDLALHPSIPLHSSLFVLNNIDHINLTPVSTAQQYLLSKYLTRPKLAEGTFPLTGIEVVHGGAGEVDMLTSL